jgi:hypothetical protein
MRFTPWLLLLIAPCVLAEDGVLVERIPAGASQEVVMAVVKQALIGRKWKVVSTTDSSVGAHIYARVFKANMVITLKDGSLVYAGDATRLVTSGPVGNSVALPTKVDMPANWVVNLRRDISLALSTIPDKPLAPKPSS